MVHALQEVGRVIAPHGLLVDLRPWLNRWPIEVAWSNGYQEVGRAADLAEPLADDAAADAAFAEHAAAVGFLIEQQESFPIFYYWDTPKEMQGYIEDEWSDVIGVDERVWADLRAAWATANPDARLRLRMKMQIRRYRT